MSDKPDPQFKKDITHKMGDKALKEDTEGSNFMLIEYQELSSTWKHTDARMESSLRLFLGTSTILVSGVAIAFTQDVPKNVISYIILFGLLLMTALGILIMKRVLGTSFIKDEYLIAINLIRGYFKDRNLAIENNLMLPTLNRKDISKEYVNDKLKDRANRSIIWAFQVGISLLAGLACLQFCAILFRKISWNNIFLSIAVFIVTMLTTEIIKEIKKKAHYFSVYDSVLRKIHQEEPSKSREKRRQELEAQKESI